MHAPAGSAPQRRRTRHQKACTECQRRKQKCAVSRSGGPCSNCLKRYPPVECVFPQKDAFPRPARSHPVDAGAGEYDEPPPGGPSSSSQWVGGAGASSLVILRNPTRWTTPAASSSRADNPDPAADGPAASQPTFILDGHGDPTAPRPLGGILTQIDGGIEGNLPIDPTPRNTELLHYFFQYVAPNLVSIDGEHSPRLFVEEMVPWMMQSPIMPKIALLSSATTQSLLRGPDLGLDAELMSLKSAVLTRVNEFLRDDFTRVASEVLRSVIHLVIMEWFWGEDSSMWAHLRGVREMIRLCGGLGPANDPLLATVLIFTDYIIACWNESDLYLLESDPMRHFEMPIPPAVPERLVSPLVSADATFEGSRDYWGMSIEVAKMLDDVRFLTLSITAPGKAANSVRKVQTTASWLHDRIKATPPRAITRFSPDIDVMHECIRSAALIYAWSIKTRNPISRFEDPLVADELRTRWFRVNVQRWKTMMGISQWVLMVACPGSGTDTKAKFIRRKMGVSGMSIGMEVFPLTIAYCKAFWRVQRWIAGHDDNEAQGATSSTAPQPS